MWRRCEMEASPPASRVDLARALRQTAITALIAFGLLLPLIGFNTVQNIHNELVLETRWPLLAALVAIITAGRFLHALLLAPWLERRAMRVGADHGQPGISGAGETDVSRMRLPAEAGRHPAWRRRLARAL